MTIDDPRKWMWLQALTALERVEYIQQGLMPVQQDGHQQTMWRPPIDIFEVDNVLWVVVALPGIAPESMKIVISSGVLSVSGERKLPSELRRSHVHRMEIPNGQFERRIELPAGNFELAQHTSNNGCLVIQLNRLS